jgi:hypothetical protein
VGFGYPDFPCIRAAGRWMFLENDRILVYEFSTYHNNDALFSSKVTGTGCYVDSCRRLSRTWSCSDIKVVRTVFIRPPSGPELPEDGSRIDTRNIV